MSSEKTLSFWEHLDELRGTILQCLLAVALCSCVAFFFKDAIFAAVLAPSGDDFCTFRLFEQLAALTGTSMDAFQVQLINTGLARQFVIHMKMSVYVALILTSPYIIFLLLRFVMPALYSNERRCLMNVVVSGYVMFAIGVAVSYFMLFPLTFRFLGTYQVDPSVENMITLDSYISTLLVMCLSMGIVFEIPVVAWGFAKLGLLDHRMMKRYRRHSIVVILILAAIITPTSDIFTLLLVSLPMCLLYEASISIVRLTAPKIEKLVSL